MENGQKKMEEFMILFLDDNPHRTKKFLSEVPSAICTTTAQGMIDLLKKLTEPAKFVFLDHDLQGETHVDSRGANTGMEVVRYIEKNKPSIEKIVVHSCNYPAAVQMTERLANIGYDVQRIPFSCLKFE